MQNRGIMRQVGCHRKGACETPWVPRGLRQCRRREAPPPLAFLCLPSLFLRTYAAAASSPATAEPRARGFLGALLVAGAAGGAALALSPQRAEANAAAGAAPAAAEPKERDLYDRWAQLIPYQGEEACGQGATVRRMHPLAPCASPTPHAALDCVLSHAQGPPGGLTMCPHLAPLLLAT